MRCFFGSAILASGILETVAEEVEGTVTTNFGDVEGNVLEDALEYLGIPYAETPARFAKPVPWSTPYTGGRLSAKSYGPTCPQNIAVATPPVAYSDMSEDCLSLNIYAPRHRVAELLPVMLWLHGGALITGSAMTPIYNASHLSAEQRVVVAIPNYRLHALGFAAVTLADGTTSANNGFKDQREAMRWVKSEIGAFRGDAGSVTLFGESAGGLSVLVHSLSPGSQELFHRGISQSGVFATLVSLETTTNKTAKLALALGCTSPNDLSCMASADLQMLIAKNADFMDATGAGSIGDDVVPAPLAELARAGDVTPPSLIIGTNADEASLFLPPTPPTGDQVRCVVNMVAGDKAAEVMEVYGLPATEEASADNRKGLVALVSDAFDHCPNNQVLDALAERGGASSYGFTFQREPTCPPLPLPGAVHTWDIMYVFNNQREFLPAFGQTSCEPSSADEALATSISTIWASFARDGKPKAVWSPYKNGKNVLRIDAGGFGMLGGYRKKECELLNQVPAAMSPNAIGLFIGAVYMCEAPGVVV